MFKLTGAQRSVLKLRLLVGGSLISLVELNSGAKKELFEVEFQR
jgi:hypothetical protein